MASVKGNPELDKEFGQKIKDFKSVITLKTLRNLDQKTLRTTARELKKVVADLEFYCDVRNEQGRGGKK